MNIDELQSVRDRERQTDRPQQLRESFYEDVGAFVEQLRAERERAAERHDSPYADEVMQLTDEIDAARQLVEDIHERRIGKVVKAASLEAAELSPEVDGLTTEERDLFETLVADIEAHRGDVLAAVEGKQPDSESTSTTGGGATASEDTGVVAADVMGEGSGGESVAHSERSDPGRADSDTRSERSDTGRADSGTRSERSDTRRADSGTRSEHPDPGKMRPDHGPGETTDGDSPSRTPAGGDSSTRQSAGERPATSSEESRDSPGSDGSFPGESPPGRDTDDREPHPTGGRTGERTGSDGRSQSAEREENPETGPTLGSSVERERVLVTEDVATFVGSDDRDYDLAADDVVTLPSTNADILVERDAARRL